MSRHAENVGTSGVEKAERQASEGQVVQNEPAWIPEEKRPRSHQKAEKETLAELLVLLRKGRGMSS